MIQVQLLSIMQSSPDLLKFFVLVMLVLMIIPALRACESLLRLFEVSRFLTEDLDRSRGTPHLLNVVYRDGQSDFLFVLFEKKSI